MPKAKALTQSKPSTAKQPYAMPKAEKATRKTKRGDKKKKGTRSCRVHPPCTITNSLTDPNAPKRGLSAYMFFANDQRDNVRQENPDVSFGQVGKILGDRWKALTEKQRVPYEQKAADDKKRYEAEKAKYLVCRHRFTPVYLRQLMNH